MRILTVHNKYLIRGGEDGSREAEDRLLRGKGHTVDVFLEDNQRVMEIGVVQTALRATWSSEVYSKIRETLVAGNYDVVDVHNFFPLVSPAVYYAAASVGVPVVQTLHNFRLLCPNGILHSQGHVCEACMNRPFPWLGVLRGCYRDSRGATLAVGCMLFVHRLLKTWQEKVNAFVVLTEFSRQKFIQGGLPERKLLVKPNFVHPDPGVGDHDESYLIYVGRLSPEKGIDVLISTWDKLDGTIPLRIMGEGPCLEQVLEASSRHPEIQYLGNGSTELVYEYLGHAQALVFPSVWYEGMPRVILEAFARGTPVIASNLGSMSTMVEHGKTGLHFTPGDSEDLLKQVVWMRNHELERRIMATEARREFEMKYTSDLNYSRLMQIYETVGATKRAEHQ